VGTIWKEAVMSDDTQHDRTVIVTAFISAITESIREAGRIGLPQDGLYDVLSGAVDRGAFDMIVDELIAQKTIKRGANGMLVYCGPCPIE
jgi:hypothetical protein